MKELKDLFVIYSPTKYTQKTQTKPESLSFWDNINRAQGVKKSEVKEKIEKPLVLKPDEDDQYDYNQIWDNLGLNHFNNTILYQDEMGLHRRNASPFDNEIVDKARKSDAYHNFISLYNQYKENNQNSGLTSNDWDILEAIAGIESGYNNVQNGQGSSAYGYFQIMPNTAQGYYSGSFNDVKRNPQLQFDIAVQHYKYLQNLLRNNSQYLEGTNLTPLQVMYGMWWRPKSMLNYLKNGYDEFTNVDGDLESILNKARVWRG